jgi:hypothetical protein
MFKKNICAIAVLALFTGCVQKNIENQTYDLSSHWFNMKDLSNNKIILNKNLTHGFNDGSETSKYTDYIVYKKTKDLNQLELYTFFEDINKQNYKNMLSNKSMDIKYSIFENEVKKTFLSENQTSSYKRNVKLNEKVIEEKKMDGSVLSCTFSKYYEKINIKDRINSFFSLKYFTEDINYNNVMELQCKDSYVDGEYYIFMAKDIGTILYMIKDMDDGSLEETLSILQNQTIVE